MDKRDLVALFMLIWILAITTPGVTAGGGPDTASPGVIISTPALLENISTEPVSVLDILPLLNVSSPPDQGTPSQVSIITVNPGESHDTNVTRPGNRVLFILNGSAEIMADDTSVNGSVGDTILVPTDSVLMVNNSGSYPLRFFSILSAAVPGTENKTTELIKRTAGSARPMLFGNESSRDQFNLTRIMSPFEEPLPLSFDLAVTHLPAGNTIGYHYLESGQIGYVLSGEGTVTIGCVPGHIKTGTLIYIPPDAVQKIGADEELSFLLITDPFSVPDIDHTIEPGC